MSFSDREPEPRRLDSESESLRLPRACTATPGKVTPSGPTYGSHARRGAGKGLRVGVPVVVTVTRSKCPRLRPRVTRCTGAFTWSASSRCRRTSFTSAERLVEARPRKLIDRARSERRERRGLVLGLSSTWYRCGAATASCCCCWVGDGVVGTTMWFGVVSGAPHGAGGAAPVGGAAAHGDGGAWRSAPCRAQSRDTPRQPPPRGETRPTAGAASTP